MSAKIRFDPNRENARLYEASLEIYRALPRLRGRQNGTADSRRWVAVLAVFIFYLFTLSRKKRVDGRRQEYGR